MRDLPFAPSPAQLWAEAGGDGDRYRALLAEHGHLVPARPGDRPGLPCGWPGRRQPTAGQAAGEAAMAKMIDAEARYATDIVAASGDADLVALANRAFEAALADAERGLDEALAAINREARDA